MAASLRLQQSLKNLEGVGSKPKPLAQPTQVKVGLPKLTKEVASFKPGYITSTTPKKKEFPKIPFQNLVNQYLKDQQATQKKIPLVTAGKEALAGLVKSTKETIGIAKKRPLTVPNVAKSLAAEAFNIAGAPFEFLGKDIEYSAERTPLRYLKTRTPLGTISAPGLIGFGATLATPTGDIGAVAKLRKSNALSKLATSVLQIPGTKKFVRLTEAQLALLKKETANKFVYHLTAGENILKKGQEITFKQLKKEAPQAYDLLKLVTKQAGKQRGFITTLKKSPVTAPQVKRIIKGRYQPVTNVETLTNAQKIVTKGYDAAKTRVFEEPLSAETNAIGQELMRQAQSAKRFDEAGEIAETLARKGTEAGQSIQAFSVWSKLSPEGMLRYAAKQIATANRNMGLATKLVRKVFKQPEAKLTAEDSKIITSIMKKAQVTLNEEEKALLIRKAWEHIGKKLPWGVSDVLDEYRYANMLSNPLTHIRNAWSNSIQTFITRPATLAAEGRPMEAIRYELAALKALPEGISAFIKSVKKGEAFGKLDVVSGQMGRIVKPRKLGRYNLPSQLMEAGDKFFSTIIKAGEMAKGTPADEAARIAEYSLFRGDLKPQGQGAVLNAIDNLTKGAYGLRNVGLGWFIPFIRTPMNIAKQWLEYSPVGVTTLIGATNKRSQLAKSMLGSVATLIGANMALEGKTTWAAPNDPIAKKLFYDSGRKPFSVKVGNRWVPLQTFGVFAWALGIPAAMKYYTTEFPQALTDSKLDNLTKVVLSPLNFWSQQTFVSGLGSFVNLAQGREDFSFAKNIGFTASQFKPFSGLMRYVTTVIDPVFRRPRNLEQQLVSDVPFLSKNLPFYETADGEPARRDISNYFTPYATGVAKPEFEDPYQQRVNKLIQNARVRRIKNIYEDIQNGIVEKEQGLQEIMELQKTKESTTGTPPQVFP